MAGAPGLTLPGTISVAPFSCVKLLSAHIAATIRFFLGCPMPLGYMKSFPSSVSHASSRCSTCRERRLGSATSDKKDTHGVGSSKK